MSHHNDDWDEPAGVINMSFIPNKAEGTEALVQHDIANRQRVGLNKYGVSVINNPLSLKQWLQHAYEECLDQAVYLKRVIMELEASNG